jgi:hypothetical protein
MGVHVITSGGRAIRAAYQKARVASMREMVRNDFPAATPETARRLSALVQLLVNVPAWVALHDNWGMTGKEAGDVVVWGLRALYAELRRNPHGLEPDGNSVEAEQPRQPQVGAPQTKRTVRTRDAKK